MSLIDTTRPRHWNSVIGQDRTIRVLQAALKNPQFMKRGFIFEGITGVGKTSVAYLLSRALMCTGPDPLGCGRCPSCSLIAEQGIETHPDFLEIAAALRSGVEQARDIVTTAEALPVLGRRRVVLLDEAQRLSNEAMDVYLKPLEVSVDKDGIRNSVFIFSTNDGNSIPPAVRNRCCKLRFYRIANSETLTGYLMKVATEYGLPYENEGLKIIAYRARGIVRDALNMTETVAAIGPVSKQLVKDVIDDTLEDYCLKIFQAIIAKNQQEAVRLTDEVCQITPPTRVVEALFGTYGRAIYRPEGPEYEAVRSGLPQVAAITSVFIKWSTPQQLLADAVILMLYELIASIDQPRYTAPNYRAERPLPSIDRNSLSVSDVAKQLGGKIRK